jgi:hypothetical protein
MPAPLAAWFTACQTIFSVMGMSARQPFTVPGNRWVLGFIQRQYSRRVSISFGGFALHLDNLCRCEIRPVLGDKWHGWHAFRRGLATTLFGSGVPAEVAQTILRHANVSTTRAHYIILESGNAGRKAMRTLEKAIGRAANGQQRKRRKSRSTA